MLRVLTMETLYSSTANGQKCVTIADNWIALRVLQLFNKTSKELAVRFLV